MTAVWMIGVLVWHYGISALNAPNKHLADRMISLGFVVFSSVAIVMILVDHTFRLYYQPAWRFLQEIAQFSQFGAGICAALIHMPFREVLKQQRLVRLLAIVVMALIGLILVRLYKGW